MPKQKTHKGTAKRVKVSARGKVKRKSAFSGHLLSHKSGNRKRVMRKTTGTSPAMNKRILTALGM